MKKSFLALGLLSMVVLSSFATTNKVKTTVGTDLKNNVTLSYGGGSGSQSELDIKKNR